MATSFRKPIQWLAVAAVAVLILLLVFRWPDSGSGQNEADQAEAVSPVTRTRPEGLPGVVGETYTDDLDGIAERGVIRALVVPSLTDFFSLEGRILGIQAELLKNLEKHINENIDRDGLDVRVVYVPVTFSELIPALLEGRGDIAAAILTRTPEREAIVDFVGGVNFPISEIVVHGEDVEDIESLQDLAGRKVHVLQDSSYAEHLEALNQEFLDTQLDRIDIVEMDPHLTTEDILELVNAGLVEITIADDYKATLWAEVLPDIEVRENIVLQEDTSAGWAVRKDNPELAAAIREASRKVRKGTLLGNIFIERYFGSTQWIDNPLAKEDRERFRRYADLFRKYGNRYGFDWVALMAQAYQESGLDHSVESPAGAVGIMQLLPTTASDPNVGIDDISSVEDNIHAGAKYMGFLQDRYFSDGELEDIDQLAFTWASYNAGPRKVRLMRAHAAEAGLDPDQWFGHVEYAALDIIGQETVRYVANIYKYYVAYRLAEDLMSARETVKTSIDESQ
ncbi:MAG: transporter substrate-binding domain-containing protein [Gammaproteobacteria bacterium]|nr:transporter substrate-binding domain-containing protein [Gammaproteobacteria bacterium]